MNSNQYVVEQMEKIARQLDRAAAEVRGAKEAYAAKGRADEITSTLNALLWMLPNLGIQTVVSAVIRDFENRK